MAEYEDRATASSLLLLLLFFFRCGVVVGSTEVIVAGGGGGGGGGAEAPLVLPLVLRAANSSASADDLLRRRRLRREDSPLPNAHMRLYDNLLTNGYYTTRLYIGTPPQEFALIVDSGSTVTYVPCSSCEQCGNHQDPRFKPDLSSTYEPVKCNIDCTCDNDKKQCVYERQYAEMSSSSGVLGEDIISFGTESALKPQRAVFGCENSETGDLYSQHADGIMGLGRGQLSIMDQLVDKGVISDSFSLCYGGMDFGGGAMVLGGISSPRNMVFSNSDPVRSPYYNIDLKEIHVAGKALRLDPRSSIEDTELSWIVEPRMSIYQHKLLWLLEILKLHSLKQIRGPDPNYKDICFAGAGRDVSDLSKTFPTVDMVFGNGQKLSLSPENYLFRHSKVEGAYCLGFFQNGKDPTTLLGGIIVRNTLVTYDRQHERIGFWKTNCSELWERLQTSKAPSPAPSSSSYTTSTIDLSPALSPSGVDSVLPGQYLVGLITFDMSINATYFDLVSHSAELAELIAHELEVDSHQVHMINITSEGNRTLIRWAIFPDGSAKFISNTTALGIISRLTEHRVRLPENFGTYQVVEWNVEPPSRRTWWEQHLVGVIIGVSMVAMLSALSVWLLWRNKIKGPGSYRPVNAVVPEQELQPL
uniref:Peptidase A1 domain-containing protein n=1 Tax=Ananas comosus var. bracteatus TaxID=296719 RepID=A0A6V7Q4E9_ANACO|nr:unnamed protein product [Ananas comosus var. bracteatus]